MGICMSEGIENCKSLFLSALDALYNRMYKMNMNKCIADNKILQMLLQYKLSV